MQKKDGVHEFSNRLDKIFEMGMPTKAMIIDAYNKCASLPKEQEREEKPVMNVVQAIKNYVNSLDQNRSDIVLIQECFMKAVCIFEEYSQQSPKSIEGEQEREEPITYKHNIGSTTDFKVKPKNVVKDSKNKEEINQKAIEYAKLRVKELMESGTLEPSDEEVADIELDFIRGYSSALNDLEQYHASKVKYPDNCKGCGTSINQSFYCSDCDRKLES